MPFTGCHNFSPSQLCLSSDGMYPSSHWHSNEPSILVQCPFSHNSPSWRHSSTSANQSTMKGDASVVADKTWPVDEKIKPPLHVSFCSRNARSQNYTMLRLQVLKPGSDSYANGTTHTQTKTVTYSQELGWGVIECEFATTSLNSQIFLQQGHNPLFLSFKPETVGIEFWMNRVGFQQFIPGLTIAVCAISCVTRRANTVERA